MDSWKKLSALVAAGAMVVALSGVASAALVTPTPVDGNIGLPGQGGDNTNEADCLLADALKLGNGNDSGTTANGVTVTQTYDEDAKETSFTATGGVVTIAYIKGGSAYNVYDYTGLGGVAADSGLVAPENKNGGITGLSHTVYCTSVVTTTTTEETTTTTEETTTEETTTEETTTTTTFTQETGGETDTPTLPPTSMVGDGPSGPSQGSWLLVAALGAFLAGAVILTPSRAKSRR